MPHKENFQPPSPEGQRQEDYIPFLALIEYRNQVHWHSVHFFWVDERCVPKEHEESNFKTAFDALLSKVPIPDENIHRIRGEEDPERGARDYEEDVRKFFGMSGLPMFDLVILGMGEDGHTASLFPGSKSLEEAIRLAVPVYLEKPNWNRITLTLPVLNNAAQIIFLVAGRSKAAVLSEILGDGHQKGPVSCRTHRPYSWPSHMVDRSRSLMEIKKRKIIRHLMVASEREVLG